MGVSQMALSLIWSTRVERWQRRNTTVCDFTTTGGLQHLGFSLSRLRRISVALLSHPELFLSLSLLDFVSPALVCCCYHLQLLVATARLCSPLLSRSRSRHNNIVICRLPVCPSLPALVLDRSNRLLFCGANEFCRLAIAVEVFG